MAEEIIYFAILMTGLTVLKALRDKYCIEDNRDRWHQIGFIMLVWVCFWSLILFMPSIVSALKIMLLTGFGVWILFDISFNIFTNQNLLHIGNSWIERKLGKSIYLIKVIGLIISLIIVL